MLKHFGKVIIVLVFGFFLLSAPNTGSATISLAFDPMIQSANMGNQASVSVMVTNPTNTPVGGFDFWVNYDSSILSLNSIMFGTSLGTLDTDPMSLNNNADYMIDSSLSPGSVELVDVWAEWDGTSALSQDPNGFSLFTINFNTLATGISPLWITDAFEIGANDTAPYGLVRNFILYDNNSDWINIDNPIERGNITVKEATSVPEPGTALLLGFGLAALTSLKRKYINL